MTNEELLSAFENWEAVQRNEWQDDCCGESVGEFESGIDAQKEDLINAIKCGEDRNEWEDAMEPYVDISNY